MVNYMSKIMQLKSLHFPFKEFHMHLETTNPFRRQE